jgi:hypothetical protein
MFLYTIAPYEYIFNAPERKITTENSNGAIIEYEITEQGKKVFRIFSTNPMDYLRNWEKND